jgi:hypothetical protein
MTPSPQNSLSASVILKIPADDAAYRAYIQRRRERLLETENLNNTILQHLRVENGDEHASTANNSNHYRQQLMLLQRLEAERNVPDPRDFPFMSCRDFSFWLLAMPDDEPANSPNNQ